MAINFTDFSKIAPQDSPVKGLLENALKGYSMAQLPAKLKEEQEKRQLANKAKSLEIEQKPAQLELERRYKEALINKAEALAKNGGKTINPNGADANFKYSHPNATPEEIKEFNEKNQNAIISGRESSNKRKIQLMNSDWFNKQPAQIKSQQFALAAGLGIDPGEAAKAFQYEGKTISDMAKERGIDPKSIVPVYPISNENEKQLQIRSSLVSELNQLDTDLSKIQGDYSRKFLGYSPKQVWDALKNKNPDEAGMILAARNLQPDLAIIRAKIGINGAIGIEALREMQNKALGNMKIFEPLVTPEARKAMDKYTDQLINKAFGAYKDKMQSYSKIQGSQNEPSVNNSPNNDMMSNALENQKTSANSFDFSKFPVSGGNK